MAGKPVSVLVTDAFGDQTPRFFNQNIDSLQLDLQAYVDAMGARLRHANHIEDEYQYELDNAGTAWVWFHLIQFSLNMRFKRHNQVEAGKILFRYSACPVLRDVKSMHFCDLLCVCRWLFIDVTRK